MTDERTDNEVQEPQEEQQPQDETVTGEQEQPEPQEPGTQESADEPKPTREAAKYRTKLRETESERDEVTAQLEAQRRRGLMDALVHGTDQPDDPNSKRPRLKNMTLVDPADFERFTGTAPADYLGDDGAVDPAKVAEALGTLHAERSYLFELSELEREKLRNGLRDHREGMPQHDLHADDGFTKAFGPQE